MKICKDFGCQFPKSEAFDVILCLLLHTFSLMMTD